MGSVAGLLLHAVDEVVRLLGVLDPIGEADRDRSQHQESFHTHPSRPFRRSDFEDLVVRGEGIDYRVHYSIIDVGLARYEPLFE